MGLGLWKIQHKIKKFYSANGSIVSFVQRNFELFTSIRRADATYIYADATNVGDYISHLGVREVFKKDGPSLYAAGSCLGETKAWLNFAGKNKNNVLIIGGGGLIQHCFEAFWETVLASGFPYVLYGVGACSMKGVRHPINRNLLARIASSATHIHIRDFYTKELFEGLGGKKVTLGECPATDFIRSWYQKNKVVRGGKEQPVLLNVIHDFDLSQSGVDVAQYCQIVKEVCVNLGFKYSQTNNIHKNFEMLLKQYEEADIVISSRLHGCIIGIGMEKQVIAIDCDDKIKNYLHTHYSNPTIIAPQMMSSRSEVKKMLDKEKVSSGQYALLPRPGMFPGQNSRVASEIVTNYF